MQKLMKNNPNYLNSIGVLFGSETSKEELFRLAFGAYYELENHEKRPLSKFVRDIFDKFKYLSEF
jgi:hypothetical protein